MVVTIHQVSPTKLANWRTGQRLYSAPPLKHRTPSREQPCTLCSSKIYIAATYLEGMHTLETTFRALGSLADDAAAVHTMTIIEEQAPGADTLTYTVFDFLPAEATAPRTVATLVTGGRVKGLLRERQLRRLPHRRCLLIGEANVAEASQAARGFNQSWSCELQLLKNDCHSHTTALVQHLTGRQPKLEKLRPLQRRPIWM